MASSTLRMRPILPVLFALTVLVAACGGSDGDAKSGGQPAKAEQALRVALIPNQEPDKVKAQYEPFGKYLEPIRLRKGYATQVAFPRAYALLASGPWSS